MIGRWAVVNTLLGLIIVALGWQIANTWTRALPAPSAEVAPGGEDDGDARRRHPPRTRREPSDDAEAVLVAITDKNLFDPNRRSVADDQAAAEAVEEEPAEPPPVTIVGVRLIGGDAEAFVQDSSKGNEQRRVRAGDAVGDYTIDEIRETSVVLSSASGESVTLWLSIEAGEPPAPARRGPARAARPAAGQRGRGAAAARRDRRATRRAAQRARRRNERQRAERSRLPQGVRERLDELRKNR